MNQSLPRKGATRAAAISGEVLEALSHGTLQSATLVEGLTLNQNTLVNTVFPDLTPTAKQAAQAASQLGILKRMMAFGSLLLQEYGSDGLVQCQSHQSDTVRGWACFMIGAQTDLSLSARLEAIKPLADDEHFGVREWAWMAIRPHLVAQLKPAIDDLATWTASPSERLRRMASEALRPRGVWCAHIAALKKTPELALPVLQPLRADPSVYVQDSVANWLNDAAKDNPDWVRSLCEKWLQGQPAAATRRICQRAMRNLD